MAVKKGATKKRVSKPVEGLLATAARTVGTVAGKIASGLGIAETEASKRDGHRKAAPKRKVPAKSAPAQAKKKTPAASAKVQAKAGKKASAK
jgi:hypothetical protein